MLRDGGMGSGAGMLGTSTRVFITTSLSQDMQFTFLQSKYFCLQVIKQSIIYKLTTVKLGYSDLG